MEKIKQNPLVKKVGFNSILVPYCFTDTDVSGIRTYDRRKFLHCFTYYEDA